MAKTTKGAKHTQNVIEKLGLSFHSKSLEIDPGQLSKPKPTEDDYQFVDPVTNQEIVSPLKFLDDTPNLAEVN